MEVVPVSVLVPVPVPLASVTTGADEWGSEAVSGASASVLSPWHSWWSSKGC